MTKTNWPVDLCFPPPPPSLSLPCCPYSPLPSFPLSSPQELYGDSSYRHTTSSQTFPPSNLPHLTIVSPSSYELPVRTIRQTIHVIEMSLLLEDVRLGLPLPHQQLPQAGAPKCKPLPCWVDGHAWNTLLGNATTRERFLQGPMNFYIISLLSL